MDVHEISVKISTDIHRYPVYDSDILILWDSWKKSRQDFPDAQIRRRSLFRSRCLSSESSQQASETEALRNAYIASADAEYPVCLPYTEMKSEPYYGTFPILFLEIFRVLFSIFYRDLFSGFFRKRFRESFGNVFPKKPGKFRRDYFMGN